MDGKRSGNYLPNNICRVCINPHFAMFDIVLKGYPFVVTAVPDPHIERWYLLDSSALSNAAALPKPPQLSAHKCDKDFYKNLLRSAFDDSGILPLQGGTEYGPLVAEKMDLDSASKLDHGLAEFVSEVRSWLKRLP